MSSLLKAGFKILAGKEKFCAVIDFCGSAHLSGRVWRRGGAAIPAKSFNYLPPPTTADYSQEKFYAWKMVGVHFSSTYLAFLKFVLRNYVIGDD
jgi:hypothetical protein